MIVLAGARVVTPDGVLDPGTVAIAGDRIADVHAGESRAFGHTPLDGHVIVPGFVDVHVHGVDGLDTLATADGVSAIAARMPRYGVTAFCPTTVACPPADLRRVLGDVGRRRATRHDHAARVLPAHLESNFINPEYRGAQPPRCLCLPPHDGAVSTPAGPDAIVAADILAVIEAAGDDVGIVTVAPELPGGLELVRRLVAAGRRVSLGHSGATYEQGLAAIEAGARHATHLFNRMPPFLHRSPGLVGAILDRREVSAELIADGHHVHPSVARAAIRLLGPDRVLAITDGTAAAGLPRGARTAVGPWQVTVGADVALLDDGTWAGSLLTMDAAFRNAVRLFGLDLETAVKVTSANQARVLGLDALGAIVPGALADLVVLDADLRVVQTYVGGRPVL